MKDARPSKPVKRDFFGRVIVNHESPAPADDEGARPGSKGQLVSGGGGKGKKAEGRIWVSYHEGFSNAVRKPIGLRELMEGL